MKEKLYTLEEAAELKHVSRQAMYLFAMKHKERCVAIHANKKARPSFWQIPESLLVTYAPLPVRQQAGVARAEKYAK